MRTAAFLLCSLSAWAIDKPHVGFILDQQGNIRAIDGLAGSFLTGDPLSPALSFASNGTIAVRKTDSQLELWDSTGQVTAAYDADFGQAIVGFDESTAIVYLRSTQTLWTLTASGLTSDPVTLPLSIGDEVLAIAGSGTGRTFAIRHAPGNTVTILRLNQNDLVDSTSAGPASHLLFWKDGSVITSNGPALKLQRTDGTSWMADAGAPVQSIRQMGANWIHLTSARKQFALFVPASGDPVFYQLPAIREDR